MNEHIDMDGHIENNMRFVDDVTKIEFINFTFMTLLKMKKKQGLCGG